MFDLFRSREKAVRWLLTALLVLVALSMVTYLIPGSGMPRSYEEQVVAEIGKDQVTARDVHVALQGLMRNRQIPSDMYSVFAPQYINSMIQDHAVAYQARRFGFEVSDVELAQAVQSMYPQLFQDGKFIGKEYYAQMLAQQNTSIEEFEANLRKQMLLVKLENLVVEGVMVTPDEVEKEFRKKSEKVKVDFIAFDPRKFQSQVSASPQEVQSYFQIHKANYSVPEKRTYDLIVIDEARIAPTVTVSDEELRRAYQAAGERYRTPERVHVRHILLKTADRPKEEVPKIEAKAADLLKQLRAGADFAELAKKNSEDTGTASKGGDLDWVAHGQTVPSFEKTAFSLKPKEISDVVKTEYGFHIIQMLEKESARVKPFDDVKKELAEERKKQLVNDRIQTAADEIRAALVKASLSADAIAKKYGLAVTSVVNVAPGDPIPELGASPELSNAVNSMQKGEVSPVIQSGASRLLVAVLKNITPSRPAEFSDVETSVRQAVLSEKALSFMQQKVKEAAEKLKAAGDIKQIAKSFGLEVKSTPEFARDGAAEGVGSASYLHEAFDLPVGSVLPPVSVGGQFFLVKVAGKSEADMSKLASERDSLVQGIKARKARQRDELFKDGVVAQLIREGKVKIHEDVIQRIVSSYTRS
jgi:peptidyl-prolyl cis-trans isomerase D